MPNQKLVNAIKYIDIEHSPTFDREGSWTNKCQCGQTYTGLTAWNDLESHRAAELESHLLGIRG